MKTHKLIPILLALPLAVASLACPTRVGLPEGDGETQSGGRGGSSATDAGSGGTIGAAGGGGSTVVAGSGARAGMTGTGGAAGATGAGGVAGATGTDGAAGAIGAGGSGEVCSPACVSATQTCVGTKCLFNDGLSCSVASQCASNACTPFYVDQDGDGYGTGQAVGFCGTTAPVGYAAQTGDCCDTAPSIAIAKLIHPGAGYQTTSAGGVCGITWDYDCSGTNDVRPVQYASDCTAPPACEAILTITTNLECGGTISSSPTCGLDKDQGSELYGVCLANDITTQPVACK
jgi:hypothetical protein